MVVANLSISNWWLNNTDRVSLGEENVGSGQRENNRNGRKVGKNKHQEVGATKEDNS